ncbi:hypothetical protein ACLOAU_17035 [Niabella sp. CJ426]|jgi:uncharacterized protein YdhG (YjbR/CyaY superfamily)|uniref:hypothetical protein n=1 Tax=Niabella sp. CJ426 TaxID=3393740 RepID=UPI003D019662
MKNTISFALLFVALCTACNSAKKNIEEPYTVQEVTIQEVTREDSIEEPPPPPPPRHTSKFATFSEWLKNLCNIENPDSRVQHYEFFLSKKENPEAADKVQYFMGITSSEKNGIEDTVYSKNRGHFYPREVYLSPPTSIYSKLSEEQAIQKINEEIKTFIQSPLFKDCFVGKAKSIRFRNKVIL